MSVRVKICGVTSVADALHAVECGVDLIGLNFYPRSPRCVTLPIAQSIRAAIPTHIQCVGVFVNAAREHIATLVEQVPLNVIQFHGDETVTEIHGWPCPIIKAMRIPADGTIPMLDNVPSTYLLLDTHRPGRYGGTGEVFAWDAAAALPQAVRQRLLLAGGLTPDNVAAAVRTVRPWAVDVASGVESTPGQKNPEKVRAFITNAKTA
ncbi:MAG: phosphoribosylanthranilate isomerase [Deltaproteobacteria bacterium]|nr:phosphoribosylanthranilate isomerase [Deltaproteobacteria bacterium]